MEKQVFNFTIFLLKETVTNVEDCLKNPRTLFSAPIKQEYGLEGKIFYCESIKNVPRWKYYLDEFASTRIDIMSNTSNKAVMIVRVKARFMALTFGYGRSFLNEEYIERNFGLRVSLNTINPNKMRSVNAATIEDMVVNTQRQASYSTTQDQFGLNVTNDIMKGITGEPSSKEIGNHISGKDSLIVSVFMTLSELKTKLELYYKEYLKETYKDNGFDWVDNIAEVRDIKVIESLNNELFDAIRKHQTDNLTIVPPETTDWDHVEGFCYSGMGKTTAKAENYRLDLDPMDYFNSVRPETNVKNKIKHDKLWAINSDETPFVVSSIYNAIVYQANYKGGNYILSSGSWYQVNNVFFDRVNSFITASIKMSSIVLPDCATNEKEGDYNERAAKGNADFCLFDKKLTSVEYGPKSIEACDIFTRQKQFIHVKNRGYSAQLSHLFAQGKVSAECFASDKEFRHQVSMRARKSFGTAVFDYKTRPKPDEFEVVYAIIHNNKQDLISHLPFFSKVNLMMTAQELERMHFKYSVCSVVKAS